ncbi:unnamed protein product [Brassica oleracea]
MAGVLLGTAISCVKIQNMLLRCQRAIQLNEIPSYAHMLSGHEYNSSLFPSLGQYIYLLSWEKNGTSWKLK